MLEDIDINADEATEATPSTIKKEKGFFLELFSTVFTVLIVLIPIRLWIAQPFIVVGSSMHPTFVNGDYLIVDEISYRFDEPKRGDVIVFRPPTDIREHYIKRIIGLPGETVTINAEGIKIKNKNHPDGFELEETYTSSDKDTNMTITLSDSEYFVMGDNRAVSSDSRIWGPLERDKISGRALVRLFPFDSIDTLPGKAIYKE